MQTEAYVGYIKIFGRVDRELYRTTDNLLYVFDAEHSEATVYNQSGCIVSESYVDETSLPEKENTQISNYPLKITIDNGQDEFIFNFPVLISIWKIAELFAILPTIFIGGRLIYWYKFKK